MAKDSIIISSTAQGGKKLQKTITNVNPEATNANLETFAQMFNGLSTNNYEETNRVKKQLTTEPDGGGSNKQQPELSVVLINRVESTGQHNEPIFNDTYRITYSGDGTLLNAEVGYTDYPTTLTSGGTICVQTETGDEIVWAEETANYKACSVTIESYQGQ